MSKVNINWSSEITKFGWQGLNDAAINTFNSNVINSFVREMFQNSNDARDKDIFKSIIKLLSRNNFQILQNS